jgi:hypothetical protein
MQWSNKVEERGKACSMKLKRTGQLGYLDLNRRNNVEGDLKELRVQGCGMDSLSS